jgi:hypothetical protein
MTINAITNQDLVGKLYVDEAGSLEIMKVVAVDDLFPSYVIIEPVLYNRRWSRNADVIREVISELKEVSSARKTIGNDKNAINRHSLRRYLYQSEQYEIDRTLDASPPFYTLSLLPPISSSGGYLNRIPSLIIPVEGNQYWGDGLSWKTAEKIAFEAIKSYASQEHE